MAHGERERELLRGPALRNHARARLTFWISTQCCGSIFAAWVKWSIIASRSPRA